MEKELLWNVLGYVVSLVVYLVLKWRYEGREAVNREAIEQEIFKEKSSTRVYI